MMRPRKKARKLKVGDIVRSVAVGSRCEFEGVIVEAVNNRSDIFNVRDADGREWCRDIGELTLIGEAA